MLIQSTGLVLISRFYLYSLCVCVFSSMHSSFITYVGLCNYHHSDALCILFLNMYLVLAALGSSLLPGGFLVVSRGYLAARYSHLVAVASCCRAQPRGVRARS